MKFSIRNSVRAISILLIIATTNSNSFGAGECMLVPVTMQNKVSNSSLIVEGKVISSTSHWNSAHNRIYTLSRVKVFKVFKGDIRTSQIEIYTDGGRVGLDLMKYSSLLTLGVDQEGIFCCEPMPDDSKDPLGARTQIFYRVYSSRQGFFEYNFDELSAKVPFHQYPDIQNSLYPELISAIGNPYYVVAPNPFFNPQNHLPNHNGPTINAVPTITSFTPTSITAGTRSLLTINGTNFGATRGVNGSVQFRDANDGDNLGAFVTALPHDYRLWSNTQIQVWVPSTTLEGPTAGTGLIKVTNNDPNTATSTGTLTITYSVINVDFNSTGQLVENENFDTFGGYTFHMESSAFIPNTAAVAAFKRAFNSWICNTHIHWLLGANTSNNSAANDGEFVVRFDVGGELPQGVLGVTSSSFSGCINGGAPGDTVWKVSDIDVTYDGTAGNVGFTWQFGPASPSGSQIDFESVCVHELGHTHTLDHIILSTAVMHWAIDGGVLKRTLNATNDIAAGNFMMTKNTVTHGACKPSAMTLLTPAASVTIGASPGTTICSGTNVTFTATPTQGGDAPVYQWKKNGGNVGANSPTYSDAALANGNTIACVMTSSISCATGNPATSTTFTMTVNPSVVASVSIARNPSGAICPGTNVVFTATPTNPGTTPVYQWKKNGTNVGTNSTSYSNSTLANNDMVQCAMTSNATCVTGSPANSTVLTVTVNSINDNNACTTDACNTTTGAISHVNLPTDDGNACTTDGCNSATGVFHNAVNINDNNACTADACNTATGAITHIGANTNDNNACTTDACNTTTGAITHTPVSVDDGNACTTDACNTSSGSVTHINVPVDDSNVCTTDACNTSTGAITHTNIPVDDGNPCTIDGCNPVTGVYHNPGVEICGNGVDDDCDGFTDEDCSVTLSLKLYMQGYYTGGGMMDNSGAGGNLFILGTPGTSFTDVDTIFVSAMNSSSPYAQVERHWGILQTNGNLNIPFGSGVIVGQNYYIKVEHRNLVETWSKLPVQFLNFTSYDFTVSSSQAYDDGFSVPMVLVDPGKWAMYNGDVNQDGGIDSQDMTAVENSSNAALYGYFPTDVTGDGATGSLDMTVIENNSNKGVFEIHP